MSDDQEMDHRCPRQLKSFPKTFCEMGVIRLKLLRNSTKELSEKEEAKLPGCPWAINNQASCYCFFKYVANTPSDKTISDIELAHLLNVSVDSVKKTEKEALSKLRASSSMEELKGLMDGDSVVTDHDSDSEYSIL